MTTTHTSGKLYIIAAPSGAGKTSLVHELVNRYKNITVSVSHTTRDKRPGEEDGINYNFVSTDTFKSLIDQGDFLEHAEVFGNYYGTSKEWVQSRLDQGLDVILEIDWQGGRQVREQFPQALSIFIIPPSKAALHARLEGRGQDKPEVIELRMQEAASECSHYEEFDYLVVNENFDQALAELGAIFTAQRLLLVDQKQRHQEILNDLLS
ncbi:guanylate kinase [Oleiphilus sp. HI0009]|uniref:guanylate kinase n=3 Tax=Oleiphilus TaxID=141450 RepID=UPI0007C2027B|nr:MULTISPECIES: guanylate kinase [unclassified Oleiphilus]KZX76805.1 guanylate kinase [Oleiphilus sp. HI0009]MCH2160035.1 guanylate kinase [Oleiphilaceae bacterium]KZY64860.1 guanylate kinase [Oleiphilus sp. HI0066]KZY71503.1 guanylate kinase [Oleiphilus sp. HI0067]KZZ58369.1 guanylate kinase [Oleiphilus sp. HI0125]